MGNDNTQRARLDIKCEHTKAVDPSTLKSHPKNANKHPANQITALAGNIKEFGWRHPIVVSKLSGFIVMGHGRRDAAIELGCNAPVDYQDFASEDEELAVLVSDNVIPELAEMDEELLKANKDLIEAAGFDLEILGFEVDDSIDKTDDEHSGSSPWDRVGSASDGVMFSFGSVHVRLDESIYDKFVSKVDPGDVERWILESLNN